MSIKSPVYILPFALLFLLSGCSTYSTTSNTTSPTVKTEEHVYLQPPSNDCEIRKWYNYQVVAIPVINKRWIETGMTLKERAKKAYGIRHDARINARFMMPDKNEVNKLKERDQQKYGNPDGPTFPYLVKKIESKGMTGGHVYKEIIQSSSRTSPMYNQLCE